MLALAALALLGLAETAKKRVVAMSALGVTLLGLACTFSRTGMVALGLGMLLFAIVRRHAWIYLLVLASGGAGMFLLSTIGSSSEAAGTADYRLKVLQSGIAVILQNPIFGNNNAIQEGRLNDLLQGQGIVDLVNSYIALGVEGGFVLISAFLLPPVVSLARYLHRRKRLSKDQRLIADVAASQLLGTLGALMVTSLTDKNLPYLLFTTGLLIFSVTKPRAADRRVQKQGQQPLAEALPQMAPNRP